MLTLLKERQLYLLKKLTQILNSVNGFWIEWTLNGLKI